MEPKIRQAVGDGAIEKNHLTWRLPRFGCQGSAQKINLKRAIIGAQLRERATVAQLLIDEAASDLSPDSEPKPGQFFERRRLPRARRAGDDVPVQTVVAHVAATQVSMEWRLAPRPRCRGITSLTFLVSCHRP